MLWKNIFDFLDAKSNQIRFCPIYFWIPTDFTTTYWTRTQSMLYFVCFRMMMWPLALLFYSVACPPVHPSRSSQSLCWWGRHNLWPLIPPPRPDWIKTFHGHPQQGSILMHLSGKKLILAGWTNGREFNGASVALMSFSKKNIYF